MNGPRIDQGMARQAVNLLPETVTAELRTRYRQLRIMIHTSGLAATYAYVAAKSTSEGKSHLTSAYGEVARGIRSHLEESRLLPGGGRMEHRKVLAALAALSLRDYTRASAEVTTLMTWLSRLADAVYKPDPQENG